MLQRSRHWNHSLVRLTEYSCTLHSHRLRTTTGSMLVPMAFGTRYPSALRLLGAIALLLFLGTLLLSAPEPISFAESPVSHVTTSTDKDGGRKPFEMEGLALGSEFVPPPDRRTGEDSTAWLRASLRLRFQETLSQHATGAPSYPQCSLKLERYARTASTLR